MFQSTVKIRTVIVDDEPLARKNLLFLLAVEGDFEIVGECADGRSALNSIGASDPELVFLDIQMPSMNGFEVLEALGDKRPPAVVFVTASDQFAWKILESHAVDCLLKPFHRERFREALARVRRRLMARSEVPRLAPTDWS